MTVKRSVEPLEPAGLPKMLEGLRKGKKTYPLVHTKVADMTGEIQCDCVMHDLRRMYSEVEIKWPTPW